MSTVTLKRPIIVHPLKDNSTSHPVSVRALIGKTHTYESGEVDVRAHTAISVDRGLSAEHAVGSFKDTFEMIAARLRAEGKDYREASGLFWSLGNRNDLIVTLSAGVIDAISED